MTTQSLPAGSLTELKPTTRAILLIDVAGSLKVCRQLGDARAYHVLKFLSETVRLAETAKGRIIRSLGDGYLLAFDSVDDALAHAITAQTEVARCNPTEIPLKIRCGIHYGEVIEADDDVFGMSIYLTSRVTSHAHGGEILLTEAAHKACSKAERPFNEFGPTMLSGFEEPVRLYEYPWG